MFDIGMSELLLIGIVALIVVGPKDLPGLFHTLGRFTAKARALGREFNRAMSDAAKESGVGDVANDLKGITNPKKFGLDKLNAAADKFEDWDLQKATESKAAKAASTDPERAADVAKIRAATEKAGRETLEREAAQKAGEAGAAEAPAKKTPAKTPAAKKPAAKKPAAKAAGTKATGAKKPAAKKPAAKSASASKPATKRKPAAKTAAEPKKAETK